MAALRSDAYDALPDDPERISELPMALQTMAFVKNDREMFVSELELYIEENGVENMESFAAEAQAGKVVASVDTDYASLALAYSDSDRPVFIKTMKL